MKTSLLYLQDSTLKTATATVQSISQDGTQTVITLDQSIFYAQGGGQPADHGTISGPNGSLNVTHVSYNGGELQHKGSLTGSLQAGDEVTLEIDWPRREHHMRLHTAGHLLDQAVKIVLPDVYGVDGDHGIGKRCFVAFNGAIPEEKLQEIQSKLNTLINEDHKISNEMITLAVLQERGVFLPFKLPENKDLRIVQIGTFQPMPDGGTHVASTKEVGSITITGVTQHENTWRVTYTVGEQSHQKSAMNTNTTSELSSLSDFQTAVQTAQEQAHALAQTHLKPEDLRIALFGKSQGLFTHVSKLLRDLPQEDRKSAGEALQALRTELESLVKSASTNQVIESAWLDATLPAYEQAIGRRHPVSQAISEIAHIFGKLGFTRVRYPEVEWEYYPFEALNMPKNHPARDEWETFFVDAPAHPQLGRMVLTPHTSSGQPREMERLHGQPPIRMVNLARTYRRQQDATHLQMFHQFEGLVVDKGITIQDLKGTIDFFAREFYGPGAKSRLRPFHFQFTEPSFEVDFSCTICTGTGRVNDEPCKFCKSGWHEVGGAGMVHPNVLRAGGIDPDVYTGFAFGWGVERTYALRPDLHLDDIRHLYSGDLRFLQQF